MIEALNEIVSNIDNPALILPVAIGFGAVGFAIGAIRKYRRREISKKKFEKAKKSKEKTFKIELRNKSKNLKMEKKDERRGKRQGNSRGGAGKRVNPARVAPRGPERFSVPRRSPRNTTIRRPK